MSTETTTWRELERQLTEPSSFERLLAEEEALETSKATPLASSFRPSPGDPEVKWLQRALNRVSSFGIAENGVPSVQTRRALQKFQSEQGLRPTGKLGPRTRALLIELSGIPTPHFSRDMSDSALKEVSGPFPGSGAPSGRCPIDIPTVIRGFSKYDDAISLLPQDQQNKLATLASEIASSQSGTSGANPVTQVIVVGHADIDPDIERRYPGFLQYVSEKRAHAVLTDLNCRFLALTANSRNAGPLSGKDWIGVGRGARVLAVPSPTTESERKCNRRAEVILVRSARLPKLPQPPATDLLADSDLTLDFYHIALQGTSGQYERPHVALQKAREIAEKAVRMIKIQQQERAKKCPSAPDLQDFTPYFKDALQGTASKYSDTDVVVERAAEIAEYAGFGFNLAQHRLEWKYATLPQPMAPDCETVPGKVPGPANHVLCGPHEHILDISTKTVIAHNLSEYQRLFRR